MQYFYTFSATIKLKSETTQPVNKKTRSAPPPSIPKGDKKIKQIDFIPFFVNISLWAFTRTGVTIHKKGFSEYFLHFVYKKSFLWEGGRPLPLDRDMSPKKSSFLGPLLFRRLS